MFQVLVPQIGGTDGVKRDADGSQFQVEGGAAGFVEPGEGQFVGALGKGGRASMGSRAVEAVVVDVTPAVICEGVAGMMLVAMMRPYTLMSRPPPRPSSRP